MNCQSACQKMSHASSLRSGMLNRKLSEVFSLVCTLGNSNIAITILHRNFESALVPTTCFQMLLYVASLTCPSTTTNMYNNLLPVLKQEFIFPGKWECNIYRRWIKSKGRKKKHSIKCNCYISHPFCWYVYSATTITCFHFSPRSDWVPLPGKVPLTRQSHSVDARRDFSRWSHQTYWVRRGESDLGLVIDIAQLFSSNVRMRQMWWYCDLTHSQNHSAVIVPGKWGHLRIQCGRSVVKKIRPLQTVPGKRDPVWTQGSCNREMSMY